MNEQFHTVIEELKCRAIVFPEYMLNQFITMYKETVERTEGRTILTFEESIMSVRFYFYNNELDRMMYIRCFKPLNKCWRGKMSPLKWRLFSWI